jgi:hypothetical protein
MGPRGEGCAHHRELNIVDARIRALVAGRNPFEGRAVPRAA